MRVLLWHGYLLRGSGSNVYKSNIARVWRAAGHDVVLMCQERDVADLDFVDSDHELTPATDLSGGSNGGRVRVVRPGIGEILPVYVYDYYEGFTAKLFVDLSDAELDAYVERNVAAMTLAIRSFRPDVIMTGHEVMGPYIAREACGAVGSTYLAQLHGSALEYAVRLQERYRRYAKEGLCGASVVVGGSRYMVSEAAKVVPGWVDKAEIVNPGCNVDLFRPVGRFEDDPPVVGYVGKLIASKGVHNLLAALGLIKADDLHAVIVGYGGFETELHALWRAFATGDRAGARAVALKGDGRPLEELLHFLDSDSASPGYFARAGSVSLDFPGRLEHGPLSKVLPRLDVLVVPSILPEAFGMVAAEAAACGVLPVVPDHSGIGEAGAAVEEAIGRPGFLTYDPAHPIEGIAQAVADVLSVPVSERREMAVAASRLARERWSWETVADSLLRLASKR